MVPRTSTRLRLSLSFAVLTGAACFVAGCAAGGEPYVAVPDGGSGGATAAGSGGSAATGSGGASTSGSGGRATTGSGGATTTGSGGATTTGSGGHVGGSGGSSSPGHLALPYLDTFEDGDAQGWIADPSNTTATWAVITDGAGKAYAEQNVTSDLSWVVGGDGAWGDVMVQAKVKLISFSSTSATVFIAARFNDFDNYYFGYLKADGSMKIRKRVAGSTTDLVTYKSKVALVMGTEYTIGFSFKGTTVTAYLNGAMVGTGVDTALSLPTGGIALGIQDTSASFDDVNVTAP